MVLFFSKSSLVAARVQKQENQEQKQHRLCAVKSPDWVLTMSVYAVILLHLFSVNLQFHFCLGLITVRPYLKYTEVTTLSEHCSSNNIRQCVRFIYWLSFFVSVCIHTIAFFVYDKLLLHCHYYCIMSCYSRVLNIYRGKNIIIT